MTSASLLAGAVTGPSSDSQSGMIGKTLVKATLAVPLRAMFKVEMVPPSVMFKAHSAGLYCRHM